MCERKEQNEIVRAGTLGVNIRLGRLEDTIIVIKEYKNTNATYKKIAKKLIENEKDKLHYLKTRTTAVVRILNDIGDKRLQLMLEYLNKGTLLDFINRIVIEERKQPELRDPRELRNFPWEDFTRGIFYRLMLLVETIHNYKVVHLDLKPENIMFNNGFELRLIDFGHSAYVDYSVKIPSTDVGTTQYQAPEIARYLSTKRPFVGKPADVFSLGVILFVFHFRMLPFPIANDADSRYGLIIKEDYEKFWEVIEEITPISASDDLKQLITAMLLNLPEERISLSEVVNHPWIRRMTREDYDRTAEEIVRLLR